MIGQTISHYQILELLGKGGMGVVYKAHDTRLDRDVALKFLPATLTPSQDELARFKQEARSISALNHPTIATIYDVDEVDGQRYLVLEYIPGGTLASRLKQLKAEHRAFSIQEVLEYGIQIAEALAHAHRRGIIHRDVKTENVMLTEEGKLKLTDFGLAKLKGSMKLTRTSSAVGTPAYMAPEQIQGEAVDARSDIFSFGVVLYELLTGHLPFRGEHEAAIMYSLLNEEPQPLSNFRSDVPPYVAAVVSRALQKDPASRFQNVLEMINDLKSTTAPGIQLPQKEKSIAVLPFENLSPDPDQEYFSDGLTEEIITDLSKIDELRVISRHSAMVLKGSRKSTRTIARELNVQYVLEGSVRKAGNNLRIAAQLIDAANDVHLWAEKYSGTLDDVFDIQEKVSRAIVDSLRVTFSPEQAKRMAERPIPNVHAYECYLRAKAEIETFTEDGLRRALRYLQKGLEIVGENAMLYAGMGYVYWQYVNIGMKQEEYLQKAEECARRAFELDPESAQGHFLLGMILLVSGNQQESARHFRKVLAANPNDPDALGWMASVYFNAGRPLAAFPLIDKLLEIAPLSSIAYAKQGIARYYDGQFDLALESFQKHRQMEPESPGAAWLCALLLGTQRRVEDAISFIDKNADAASKNVFAQLSIFLKKVLLGDDNVSGVMTDEFIATTRRDLQYSCWVADLFALLDHKKESLDWLENTVNRGFTNYPFLAHHDPFLQNIRGEERYKELMERVKEEWEHFEVGE